MVDDLVLCCQRTVAFVSAEQVPAIAVFLCPVLVDGAGRRNDLAWRGRALEVAHRERLATVLPALIHFLARPGKTTSDSCKNQSWISALIDLHRSTERRLR